MAIKDFIKNEIFLPRLRESRVLIVYDPDNRYREICRELASANRIVIDAGESSIEGREQAMKTLQDLCELEGPDEMIVYVPARKPLSDEDKQRDPFSIYISCGALFPTGAGDELEQICLRARADHATEIRRIFSEDPNASFEIVDMVGGGSGWPTLQAALKVESARDILFALLVPTDKQKEALKTHETWVSEAKEIFLSSLGLRLVTRGKTWSAIADELWRFLLFSEFFFDLSEGLPEALKDVPKAIAEARPLVDDLCDRLRSDKRTQATYIERAEIVEQELRLPTICENMKNLGLRETFPFEQSSSVATVAEALKADNIDKVREILSRHLQSVWIAKGENQAQWALLEAAFKLIQECEDTEPQLVAQCGSQDMLLDFYAGRFREVDRLHREFEQAMSDFMGADIQLSDIIQMARDGYQKLVNKAHDVFIKRFESVGWPPAGRIANAEVFDRFVAPKLQESGRKTAFLLIDALRYELGVELGKQLSEFGQVDVHAAYASLPSITAVGMASLLPGAKHGLTFVKKDDQLIPVLIDQQVATVAQRMDVLRKRYGERFAETTLTEIRSAILKRKFEPPSSVELMVIRSNIIDSQLEATPEMALKVVQDSLKVIRFVIHELREKGFQDVVIASDHGFFLNSAAGPGDICSKPPGAWLNVHERLLLGDGNADAANFVLPAKHVGLHGDFNEVAGPRSPIAYRAGESYLHGGASLQELIVPVITVRMQAPETVVTKPPTILINYKGRRITTRLPVIDIKVGGEELFTKSSSVEILLEAHDKKGRVIGEAKPGGLVNPATRTITVNYGDTVQVALKMDLDFEGKFTVKALDPATLTTYSKLDLETDYTV